MLVKIDKDGANIVPDGAAKVRVRFEMDRYDSNLEAVFECLTCTDLLLFADSKKRWICPSCSYELHQLEADMVVMHARVMLDQLQEKLGTRKKKIRWAWVTWLRQLLRLKEA